MGRVRIKGAKNACLPMMAASLLTPESVVLEDVRTWRMFVQCPGF